MGDVNAKECLKGSELMLALHRSLLSLMEEKLHLGEELASGRTSIKPLLQVSEAHRNVCCWESLGLYFTPMNSDGKIYKMCDFPEGEARQVSLSSPEPFAT